MSFDGRTKPTILETTLRDGSYAIDFQFTARDTALISAELERVGLDLIEVGHGIGLGASESGHGEAAETDEAYLRATAGALDQSRWGMFCIPGIARLEHLDLAASYGMSFVRVGTNVTEAPEAEPFIAKAKDLGMLVAANFMKSYALEPTEFAETARLAEGFGADVVYIVDSAGGMLPGDLEHYVQAIRERTSVSLGFHGHNNLGLAVANSLRAHELGVDLIDTSLQGLGRSAGNAPTEMVVALLDRLGVPLGINPLEVMDVGERYIRPLIETIGYDSVDVTMGYAQFHSSYMGLIREYSNEYGIDPRRLIIAVTAEDKVNANRELVEQVAKQVHGDTEDVFTARFRLDRYHGAEQLDER